MKKNWEMISEGIEALAIFVCGIIVLYLCAALMDACEQLASSGEYPEDDVEYIDFVGEEDWV